MQLTLKKKTKKRKTPIETKPGNRTLGFTPLPSFSASFVFMKTQNDHLVAYFPHHESAQ